MLRRLVAVIMLIGLGAGALYVLAGRSAGPAIEIRQPERFIGSAGTLEVDITSPAGRLTAAHVEIEQNGTTIPLFSLAEPGPATVTQDAEDRIRVTRPYDRESLPGLQPGPARVLVRAGRSVLFGVHEVTTEAAREVTVRFEPPRVTVLSTHHFVNHGGSELVVYRVDPADAETGVRVADVAFSGYSAAEARIPGAGPDVKLAFFALLHDQDLEAPIEIFARDEAGNEARVPFAYRVFPKTFRRSRIEIDARFLERVVPAIYGRSEELRALADGTPPDELLPMFLTINGDLRQKNAETIAALAARTAPRMLWTGAFTQLGGSQVESGFADYRTYFFEGREVDRQVHLGFDLASTANVPVHAANRGVVLYAGNLGIYGNCVIVDHGLGLQSLYAHLSSLGVGVGDQVEKGQEIGRSGMTGLAGGDHLHFTMLLQGHAVTPIEWWDPHWIDDRIARKLDALRAE